MGRIFLKIILPILFGVGALVGIFNYFDIQPQCAPSPKPAPAGDLTGYVLVKYKMDPVNQAEVTVCPLGHIGDTKCDYSRSTGRYAFKSLPVGDYDFAVKKDGYMPNPYTDIIRVLTDTTKNVYLLPEEALTEATLFPGPSLSLPDWAGISAGLDIKVTSLASPQVVTLDFAGIMQEMVFMNLSIENMGDETVYLDFREAYLGEPPPISPPFTPELKYDLASSLFAPDGLQNSILKLEPYQKPIVGTVAFVPIEGAKLPPGLESVVPTFWAFREVAPLELKPVYPPRYTPLLPGIFD